MLLSETLWKLQSKASPEKWPPASNASTRQWLQREGRREREREGKDICKQTTIWLPKSQWDGCLSWGMGSEKEERREGEKKEQRCLADSGQHLSTMQSTVLDSVCAQLIGPTATPVTKVLWSCRHLTVEEVEPWRALQNATGPRDCALLPTPHHCSPRKGGE